MFVWSIDWLINWLIVLMFLILIRKIWNWCVCRQLENLVSKNYYLNTSAKEGYKAYVRAYATHSRKDIFDVNQLDLRKVALSFGLQVPPHVDFSILTKSLIDLDSLSILGSRHWCVFVLIYYVVCLCGHCSCHCFTSCLLCVQRHSLQTYLNTTCVTWHYENDLFSVGVVQLIF